MILNKTVSFPTHIIFQEFDDESVLLDIRTQEHFGLDPIANEFVKNIYKGASSRHACELILQDYDVEKEELEKDLSALLEALVKHKLIEVS